MPEAAAVHIVAKQSIQGRAAGLDKPGIGGRVDAQGGQAGDDLGDGFAGGNRASVAVVRTEGAVRLLHLRQLVNGPVHGGADLLIGFIVGSQSL